VSGEDGETAVHQARPMRWWRGSTGMRRHGVGVWVAAARRCGHGANKCGGGLNSKHKKKPIPPMCCLYSSVNIGVPYLSALPPYIGR
jgi:hypothetical protein